jgi:hypothetical protein
MASTLWSTVTPPLFTDRSGLSVWGITHGIKDKIIENDSKRDVFFKKNVIIHLFIRVFTVKYVLLPKEMSLRYVL